MKTRKAFLFLASAGFLAAGGACSEAAGPQDSVSAPFFSVSAPDTMYKLIGQGDYYDAGGDVDLRITAVRHFNGDVTGDASDPANARYGPVVGLTPPTETSDAWCVEFTLTNTPGFTVVAYVKDRDGTTALDQVHFGGGFGSTCANYPMPGEAEFSVLLKGDFEGNVKIR